MHAGVHSLDKYCPLNLTFPLNQSWIPNPLLPIYIRNIHKCKHGSDSETYDTEGRLVGTHNSLETIKESGGAFNHGSFYLFHRFDPSKFDAIFSKYAVTNPNALTSKELDTMLQANRNLLDYIGWSAYAVA